MALSKEDRERYLKFGDMERERQMKEQGALHIDEGPEKFDEVEFDENGNPIKR